MISKKKIVAIVLFILMGFVMFTFANPSDGIDSLTNPIDDEPVAPVKEPEKEVIVNPVVPVVVVDNAPVITVEPAIVKIVEGTEYNVLTGVTATDDKDTNLVINSSITSVDKVGEYDVTYTVTDSANHTATATRKIYVLEKDGDEDNDHYTNEEELEAETDFDDEESIPEDLAPIITVEPETVTIEFGTDYDLNTGVEVTDDFDSLKNGKLSLFTDITDTSSLTVGTYTVTYTVEDRKENKTTATRVINVVDTTAPTISLNGDKNITLEAGIDVYTELNATATDIVDGTWTVEPTSIKYTANGKDAVEVDSVDTRKVGSYEISYSCEDKAGIKCLDEAKENEYVVRKVVLVDTIAPVITGVKNNEYYNNEVVFNVTDNTDLTVEVDGNIVTDYTVTTDGSHTIKATDAGGKTAEVSFIIDKNAPVITGIQNGATYANTVTYSVEDTYLNKIIVDGNEYTAEKAPYTITEEGSHTVTALDYSNNSISVTFTIERRYSVTFKDYNGNVISTQSVVRNGDATLLAPNMNGKSYNSNGITYTFTNWNKNLTNINENTEVTAIYDITEVIANVYLLNEGLSRPSNGDCSLGGTKDYTKIGTAKLVLNDNIKTITKNKAKRVLTSDVIEVLGYIADPTALPVPSDSKENFTKYEWYTLKYENDGWHIDGEKVFDIAKYRENAIEEIKSYASNLGFDANLPEITNIINASGINNLTTKTKIDEAVTEAKTLIDSLLNSIKEQAKKDVAAFNAGFNDAYKSNANKIVADGNTNITNATNVSGVNEAKGNAIKKLEDLKALMSKTFNVSLINDKNNILISNIASDVAITKVTYDYFAWSSVNVYNGPSNQMDLIITSPLDEGYRDVNYVIIEYTKNGQNYRAIYEVKYKHEWFKGSIPDSIEQSSDTYRK